MPEPDIREKKFIMLRCDDPPGMPGTGGSPVVRLERAAALAGTPAEAYLERRGKQGLLFCSMLAESRRRWPA